MIFLDSTYLIGLMIDNDDYHEQSHQLRPIIDKERKLINNAVLVEVLNSLKKNNHKLGLDETMGITQKTMAELFGKNIKTVSKNLTNIFESEN